MSIVKTLKLKSGGTLTVTVDRFELAKAAPHVRTFVAELLNALDAYEATYGKPRR